MKKIVIFFDQVLEVLLNTSRAQLMVFAGMAALVWQLLLGYRGVDLAMGPLAMVILGWVLVREYKNGDKEYWTKLSFTLLIIGLLAGVKWGVGVFILTFAGFLITVHTLYLISKKSARLIFGPEEDEEQPSFPEEYER